VAGATVAIAIFTLTLWRSTDKLWESSEAQISVAAKATAAAELSAQAAIGVKLPRLHTKHLELYKPGLPYGSSLDSFKFTIRTGVPPQQSQIAITFHNFGETNAFVTGICIAYVVAARLPKMPTYEPILPIPADTIVEARR
jgi:hypothetical protein